MRITVRIAQAEGKWWPNFPRIDAAACFPKVDGVECFDEGIFRRQAASQPAIQIAGGEEGTPLAFAAILIDAVDAWLDDEKTEDTGPKITRIKKAMQRRLAKGRTSAVRVDITGFVDVINGKTVRRLKIRIRWDMMDAIGENFAEGFAMILADFCRTFSQRYEAKGDPPFVFTPETEGLLAKLHAITVERTDREKLAELNAGRFTCPYYHTGFCAPCQFKCPHYNHGRCVELFELPKRRRS